MTKKYHINEKGNPGICTAQPGNCPLGEDAPHYESQSEARAGFEKTISKNTVTPPRLYKIGESRNSIMRDKAVDKLHELAPGMKFKVENTGSNEFRENWTGLVVTYSEKAMKEKYPKVNQKVLRDELKKVFVSDSTTYKTVTFKLTK